MNPHPHAEVLRAIADGVPLSEFEIKHQTDIDFGGIRDIRGWNLDGLITTPHEWQIRRKPQHIMVNGFKVPKPLDVAPEHLEQFFYPEFAESDLSDSDTWQNHIVDKNRLKAGVCHATKEAAIAHAKAMLGIDPEYFK